MPTYGPPAPTPRVNFFDRLSYPEYVKDGRFNLLSLAQLPYAFTRPGTREIYRTKDLGQRAQRAGVEQAELGAERTAAETSRTGAETRDIEEQTRGRPAVQRLNEAQAGQLETSTVGAELANQNIRTAQERERQKYAREEAARLILPRVAAGVPADLGPEYNALVTPIDEARRREEEFKNQQEMMGLGLGETRDLARRGKPITQPGQHAAALEASTASKGKEIESEERRTVQAGIAHMLGNMFLDPSERMAILSAARKSGYPIAEFNMATGPGASVGGPSVAPPGSAAAIQAELDRRKAAGAQPPTPSVRTNTPAPAPAPAPTKPAPAAGAGVAAEGKVRARRPEEGRTLPQGQSVGGFLKNYLGAGGDAFRYVMGGRLGNDETPEEKQRTADRRAYYGKRFSERDYRLPGAIYDALDIMSQDPDKWTREPPTVTGSDRLRPTAPSPIPTPGPTQSIDEILNMIYQLQGR